MFRFGSLLQYRTMLTVIVLGFVLLVGLMIVMGAPVAALQIGVAVFVAFASAVVGLAGAQATKSAAQHLGGSGGIKGAVASLMTDAKPGDPAPTPAPAPEPVAPPVVPPPPPVQQ